MIQPSQHQSTPPLVALGTVTQSSEPQNCSATWHGDVPTMTVLLPRPPMPWTVLAPWQNEELFWLEEDSCRGDLQVLAEVPAVLVASAPGPSLASEGLLHLGLLRPAALATLAVLPPVSQHFLVCWLFVTCLLPAAPPPQPHLCHRSSPFLFPVSSFAPLLLEWTLPFAGVLPAAVCPPWAWEIASQNGSCPDPGKSSQDSPCPSHSCPDPWTCLTPAPGATSLWQRLLV